MQIILFYGRNYTMALCFLTKLATHNIDTLSLNLGEDKRREKVMNVAIRTVHTSLGIIPTF